MFSETHALCDSTTIVLQSSATIMFQKLMPRVSQLDLSYNRLQDVQQLQHLSSLCHVDLSYNHVRTLTALHTRLGNVKKLNFAANKLDSLVGKSELSLLTTRSITVAQLALLTESSYQTVP